MTALVYTVLVLLGYLIIPTVLIAILIPEELWGKEESCDKTDPATARYNSRLR